MSTLTTEVREVLDQLAEDGRLGEARRILVTGYGLGHGEAKLAIAAWRKTLERGFDSGASEEPDDSDTADQKDTTD